MSTLLLITKLFPFAAKGSLSEPFLAAEIPYLAQCFDYVIVAATTAKPNYPIQYSLPENVQAIPLDCGFGSVAKLKAVLKGVTIPFCGSLYAKEAASSEKGLCFTEKIFQLYSISRSVQIFDKVLAIIADKNAVLTHVYSYWFFDTALAASWIKSKFPEARVLSRAHGYDLYASRNRLNFLPFRDYLIKNIDTLCVCSADGKRYLLDNYGESFSKAKVVYLGTQNAPDKSDEARRACFNLLSCSQVYPLKRVSLILEALQELDDGTRAISWTHYGAGVDYDKLKEESKKLRYISVNLVGNVAHDELLDDYGNSHFDLFINASTSEGLPVSIMEACSYGIPIVATDVGGVREIVENNKNGLLLSADLRSSDLAEAIRFFYEMDDRTLRVFRKNARDTWEASYRIEQNMAKLISFLL